MTSTASADWSPADNPHAIAISEAQWWQRTVALIVLRLRDPDDQRISWFSSRQIDGRLLIFALRQILNAEQLLDVALEARDIDTRVRDALARARQEFVNSLPGIKDMRDALMHFDEWARGEGRGPQKGRVKAGDALRDIARDYWGFGYDPIAGTISLGPYTINIDVADQAAAKLAKAIYLIAREVDKKTIAELRTQIVETLTAARIDHNTPGALLKVSPGNDLRIWLSLNIAGGSSEPERRELCEQIVSVLTNAGISLISNLQAENMGIAERLMRGEMLYAELAAAV